MWLSSGNDARHRRYSPGAAKHEGTSGHAGRRRKSQVGSRGHGDPRAHPAWATDSTAREGPEELLKMPATQRITVLIADDHAILRAGLKMLINAQADMEVVAEAPDGDRAVQAARETTPNVVLMDLSMPGSGGMGALEE